MGMVSNLARHDFWSPVIKPRNFPRNIESHEDTVALGRTALKHQYHNFCSTQAPQVPQMAFYSLPGPLWAISKISGKFFPKYFGDFKISEADVSTIKPGFPSIFGIFCMKMEFSQEKQKFHVKKKRETFSAHSPLSPLPALQELSFLLEWKLKWRSK